MEDMYEAWAHDPSSVHPSWNSYFTNGSYQAPPTLGAPSRPNEMSLSSLGGQLGGLMGAKGADGQMVEAHLAVQGAIRYCPSPPGILIFRKDMTFIEQTKIILNLFGLDNKFISKF